MQLTTAAAPWDKQRESSVLLAPYSSDHLQAGAIALQQVALGSLRGEKGLLAVSLRSFCALGSSACPSSASDLPAGRDVFPEEATVRVGGGKL